ncbi:MAG: transposase [Nitrospirota bacterium]|nr:transposase [Nitrospirota bacterium]
MGCNSCSPASSIVPEIRSSLQKPKPGRSLCRLGSKDSGNGSRPLNHQFPAPVSLDLPSVPEKHPTGFQDYGYERPGTVLILTSIDPHNVHAIARIRSNHRSRELIELLDDIETSYRQDGKIRVVEDNHSTQIAVEKRGDLSTRPNRFVYAHSPKHRSWLNLAESLFSRTRRTFLRQIRVFSREELTERILKGVEEIDTRPLLHQRRKFDFESRSA